MSRQKTCSYCGCKNEVKYWIKKKKDCFWYCLCEFHLLSQIIQEEKALDQLLKEKIRKIALKIQFQEKSKKHPVNWKMFIDWEELAYHPAIKVWEESYGDIQITLALQKHQRNTLKKYIKKMKEKGKLKG